MTSNLTTFNATLKEFLTNLINTFPQTETEILNHYRPLLEDNEFDVMSYCTDFMTRAHEYQKDIADKNEKIFHHSICLFPGIDFEVIWNSNFNTPKTKKTIWIYLNVFWSLGSRVKEEEIIKQKTLKGLSDNDKILLNLQEATKEQHQQYTSSKKIFIQNLTDKELINELERRKEALSEQQAENADEEDLLNFDPNQGYSIWNAVKGLTGNKSNMFGGLSDIFKTISDTFGIDLSTFDMSKFDIGNVGNSMKDMITPENMNKLRETLFRFAAEFQNDIDSGDINKSELSNVFDMIKDNIFKIAKGDFDSPEEQHNMMENLLDSSSKLFGKSLPPEMRGKFKEMTKKLMNDPNKIREMMANPAALMEEMGIMGKGMQNRFNAATRNEKARDRMTKKYEEKQQMKQAESTQEESTLEESTSAKKKKNRKRKRKTATSEINMTPLEQPFEIEELIDNIEINNIEINNIDDDIDDNDDNDDIDDIDINDLDDLDDLVQPTL